MARHECMFPDSGQGRWASNCKTYLFPEDEKRRGEPWVLVDEVDGGLVNESGLALGSEHPPFLLVEAHVGIQPHAEQSDDLQRRRWIKAGGGRGGRDWVDLPRRLSHLVRSL